jgi:hypothetical protein
MPFTSLIAHAIENTIENSSRKRRSIALQVMQKMMCRILFQGFHEHEKNESAWHEDLKQLVS